MIFAVPDFRPRPELLLLCVESAEDEDPIIWVFPSTSFLVYADRDAGQGMIRLNLDSARADSSTDPLREYVSFFRNRWEPIVQFDDLRQYMPPVEDPEFQRSWEDFEDILLLMELSESPRWDAETRIPFEPPDPGTEYGNTVCHAEATSSWRASPQMTGTSSRRQSAPSLTTRTRPGPSA